MADEKRQDELDAAVDAAVNATGEALTSFDLGAVYYDGKQFLLENKAGRWIRLSREDMSVRLRVNGYSKSASKGSSFSELDRALNDIIQHRTVAFGAPFVHRPKGRMKFQGQEVINTTNVELMQPADEPAPFPWVARFLDTFFMDRVSYWHFLAWLKYWYTTAEAKDMRSGQAVFIAGPVGIGKTFLSNVLLSRIFGGHVDAAKFLTGEAGYNSKLISRALWTMDDAQSLDDRKRRRFSEAVKATGANDIVTVSEKYQVDGQVSWTGRLVVTTNEDPVSLGILPEGDLSNLDKVNLYRAAPVVAASRFPFPGQMETDEEKRLEALDTELRGFLRWLLDTDLEAAAFEELRSAAREKGDDVDAVALPWLRDVRFGVTAHHDEELHETTQESSPAGAFADLLVMWLEDRPAAENVDPFVGEAAELLRALQAEGSGVEIQARKINSAYTVSRYLGQLVRRGMAQISAERSGKGRGRLWAVAPFHEWPQAEGKSKRKAKAWEAHQTRKRAVSLGINPRDAEKIDGFVRAVGGEAALETLAATYKAKSSEAAG